MKNLRNVPGDKVQDPAILDNLKYNDAAGSQKVSEVGRHLLPLKTISGNTISYTTNATTAKPLDNLGSCLAVYNNDTTVHAVTVSPTAIAALAAGVTDANGNVGIPCMPAAWTYIACDANRFVIADSANLMVFLIDDDSSIKPE